MKHSHTYTIYTAKRSQETILKQFMKENYLLDKHFKLEGEKYGAQSSQ